MTVVVAGYQFTIQHSTWGRAAKRKCRAQDDEEEDEVEDDDE